jgi:hypothetical protein
MRESGQIAIVVLLIMVVMLTVGLSLATRTTQEVFLSQQDAESTRIFNAAETGIEEALSYDFSSVTGTQSFTLDVIEDVDISGTITSSNVLETHLPEGAAVHLDLEGYIGLSVAIRWSYVDSCSGSASILASIYYVETVAGVQRVGVIHDAFAPGDCRNDDFSPITTNPPGSDYTRQKTVQLPPASGRTYLFARFRAVYRDTPIRISGGTTLPTQFFTIRSDADSAIGEESRSIQVGRTLSGAPSIMDYSLYSGVGIVQAP